MAAQDKAEEGDSIRVVDMDNGTFASGGPNTGKHSVDCCLSKEYDIRQHYLIPTRGPKFLAFGKEKKKGVSWLCTALESHNSARLGTRIRGER